MIARVDCYVADVIHNVCYCCFSPCAIAVLDWACVVQSGWCLPNWFILALHLSVIEVIGIYRWRIDLMVSISVILVWCSPFALNVSVFVLTFDFWSVWSFSFGSVWHSFLAHFVEAVSSSVCLFFFSSVFFFDCCWNSLVPSCSGIWTVEAACRCMHSPDVCLGRHVSGLWLCLCLCFAEFVICST